MNRELINRWMSPRYRHRRQTLFCIVFVFVLVLCLFALSLIIDRPRAYWDGVKWNCTQGDVYADEHEARAGQPFVHCVEAVQP